VDESWGGEVESGTAQAGKGGEEGARGVKGVASMVDWWEFVKTWAAAEKRRNHGTDMRDESIPCTSMPSKWTQNGVALPSANNPGVGRDTKCERDREW
jgi:hypothetical protein